MQGTIDLYNLALTPNDTMYFDSVEAQTEWFDNQEHLSIEDISFNGLRAFQLGKNYLDVIFNYNYVRYKLNDRYIYAFIENVIYTNDNCCELNISIDLNQTFLNELQTAIVKSNVANSTEKNSFFNTYKPYSNKLSVTNYNVTNLNKLAYSLTINNKNYLVGFILINLELPNDNDPNKYYSIKQERYVNYNELLTSEANFTYPFSTIIKPVLYNISNQTFEYETLNHIYFVDNTNTNVTRWESSSLQEIIKEFGSYIVNANVGFVMSKFSFIKDVTGTSTSNIQINIDTAVDAQLNLDYISVNGCSFITILDNKNYQYYRPFYKETINLPLYNIPKPLQRLPYCFVRVGCDTNYIDINLLDFYYSDKTNTGNSFSYTHFTSVLYPFTTTFNFYYNNLPINDPNLYFNINSSSPLPFSVSAWQNYYSTHSASVNDGLATEQKYSRQQSGLQLANNLIQGGLGVVEDLAPFTKAGKLSRRKLTQQEQFSGAISGIGTILNAGVQYANSELERQKQRALLEIEWNDIKSSPSEFSNAMTNFSNLLYNNAQVIEVNLYVAMNIDDIKNYHKQYGYQVNRMQSLPWNTIKKHTVFDFISFNEITIKSSLPQFYTAMIEQQFEKGVRFWYDYNNFMNFDIENTEITGGSQ